MNPQQPPLPPVTPEQPISPQPPQGTPVQSVAYPQQPTAGYVPMPPQKSGSGAKITIIIGSIVGVLVLIGVIATVLISTLAVSKKDYLAASMKFSDITTAQSKLNMSVSNLQYSATGSTSTNTSFSNDLDSAKKAIETMKEENEAMGKMKGVRSGEGKELYTEFSTKLDAYLVYTTNLVASLEKLRDPLKSCDSNSSATDAASTKVALAACVTALDNVGSVPDKDINTFITEVTAQYKEMTGVVDGLAAITDPYGKSYDQYKALRDKLYAIQDDLRDSSTDFQSNLTKHAEEVNPKKAAGELQDFLQDKSIK